MPSSNALTSTNTRSNAQPLRPVQRFTRRRPFRQRSPGTLVIAVQDGELMVIRLGNNDSRPIDLWGVVT